MRTRVFIESPFAATVPAAFIRHRRLLRRACQYAVSQGFNPFASHLFYTQFLDDLEPLERNVGIQLGLEWATAADEVWFILPTDYPEMSPGMKQGWQFHVKSERRLRYFRTADDGVSFQEVGMFS